jgi:hypothetical protein
MDDTKQYKIQIKGVAYTFSAMPDDDLANLQLIFNMNASVTKVLKAVTRVLRDSAGAEAWDELTDRLINKEITLDEMVTGPVKKLIERQVKDRKTDKSDD